MKKLTLDLDNLEVESFATDLPDEGEGTVLGLQASDLRTRCCPHTYRPSCADTCTC